MTPRGKITSLLSMWPLSATHYPVDDPKHTHIPAALGNSMDLNKHMKMGGRVLALKKELEARE